MEDQIPASQIPGTTPEPSVPAASQAPIPGQITMEQLELMKAKAREIAIQQATQQAAIRPVSQPQPKVVYVRRNLTVAELLLVFLLSSGIVLGIQGVVSLVFNYLPRIEVKVK